MMPKHRIKNASQQALNAKPPPQVEGNLSRYASRISLASQLPTTSHYISQNLSGATDEPISLVGMTGDELKRVMEILPLKVEPHDFSTVEQEDILLDQITEEDDTTT